jgi:hypothetical protein
MINDMDTISGAGLAREFGTSVPRITRAIERLEIDARQANGRFALTQAQAERLRRALGITPQVEGLTRPEVLVLAALRSAPFGLVSARAVARRTGLSPTAAAHALKSLLASELVTETSEVVAAGWAREMNVWHANVVHPRWAKLDPILDRVRSPERPKPAADRVPGYLRHLFWNTAESQLDVDDAGAYIARRLLQTMDLQGLAWGAQALNSKDWRQAARARGLDSKVKRLAINLGDFTVTHESEGTLKGLFGATKIEVFDASRLLQLAKPTRVAELNIASLQDLMAMKIKVMAERGEARDYFDVKAIDENGAISVEEGIELYLTRYDIDPSSDAVLHLYRAMGDLSDVEVDEQLPIGRPELQAWWSARQVRVLRNSDRFN